MVDIVAVGVQDGVVQVCVSVHSFDDVTDYYPGCTWSEQRGTEDIGWAFDGTQFTAPE